MIVYIDSSILLSIIFQEESLPNSIEIWKKSKLRVSSILLEAECKISIKRTYLHNKKKVSPTWKDSKLNELQKLIDEISLKNIDSSTIENIDKEETLAGCRTLDALHLATALEFQNEIGEDFYIFSYDKDFNKVATELGLNTL
ncbi:PIN domain-containing protein [Leptospira sp. WS39.C2]